MPTSFPLRESASAIVGADGRAIATLQPLRAFERWQITRITVQCSSQTLIPTARVYRGSESPSALIDGTYTGTLDTSDSAVSLENGERLLTVWEGQDGGAGADVGSSCTVTVEGKSIRG
jgi:hypothetical protein